MNTSGAALAEVNLPVFEGDLAHWGRDMVTLRNALARPEGYRYEVQLPEIIGYVATQEAAQLSLLPEGVELSISDDEGVYGAEYIEHLLHEQDVQQLQGLQIARHLFSDLLTKIEEDIALTMGEKGSLKFVELEKKITEAGEVAKGNGHMHVDDMVGSEDDLTNTHYLIADTNPTLFYEGKAKLFRLKNGRLRLDTDSLDTSDTAIIIPAPPLAIVRTNGTTVHGSPRFASDASRAWFRVSAGLSS